MSIQQELQQHKFEVTEDEEQRDRAEVSSAMNVSGVMLLT